MMLTGIYPPVKSPRTTGASNTPFRSVPLMPQPRTPAPQDRASLADDEPCNDACGVQIEP